MLRQVIRPAMGAALEFLRLIGEWEHVLDVGASLGVMREFLGSLLAWPQSFRLDAKLRVPRLSRIAPVFVPLHRFVGMAEELDLHLLEFPAAEGIVARVDLIAKCLADLRDAKRQLHARAVE